MEKLNKTDRRQLAIIAIACIYFIVQLIISIIL